MPCIFVVLSVRLGRTFCKEIVKIISEVSKNPDISNLLFRKVFEKEETILVIIEGEDKCESTMTK